LGGLILEEVTVTLPTKTYQIKIADGLLATIGTEVAALWQTRKIAVISDRHVAPLYADQVLKSLTAAGFEPHLYLVEAGEASKSLGVASSLYDELVGDGFTRTDGVIALGGGVVGDLAGFVASTYMRGLAFIQIPTSLLAQVDSSVGGKTAVDLPSGKNLVGSFYQPDLVAIDPTTLKTLSQRYIVEGYAEILKMAAIDKPEFWQIIEKINQPADIVTYAQDLIKASVAFKAKIVIADEQEGGLRQILNFGHTMGHSIELLAAGELAHGEAISIGMVQLTKLFEAYQLSPAGLTQQLTTALQKVGLPTESDLIGSPAFYENMRHDKKNRHGKLNLVYLKAIGEPVIYPVQLNELETFFSGQATVTK
jgi:3-dehydroquinate synthase